MLLEHKFLTVRYWRVRVNKQNENKKDCKIVVKFL